MRVCLGVIAVVIGIGCAGCATSGNRSEHQDSTHFAKAEASRLALLDDEWSRAAATRDAAKVASYYAEDATAYPPNEPMMKGRAAAQSVWASYFTEPSFTISWKTVHAEVSGDLGYTTGTYTDSFKGPDGKVVHEKGKYVCIWKRQKDGSWKAIHDAWNSDAK